MRDYRIIDTHVHIYPDQVAAKVAATIGLPSEVSHPERLTAQGIVASQKRAGISLSVNLPVATRAEHVEGTNAFAQTKMPEGVISFASIHPDTPNPGSALRELKDRGFKGVKFHPEFQNFKLDDSRVQVIWREMSALGLIAYFHAGGDRSFGPPFKTEPRDFANLAAAFPLLRIVAAHMGGYQMWYASETDLCGRANLYLDSSWMLALCDPKQCVRMIRRHGAEKILFATDAPWREPIDDVRAFLDLPLTEDERELILHGNAEKLLEL